MTAAEHDRPAASVGQLRALAHPLRLRILRLCRDRELTNKELADALGIAPGTALRHVRELVQAGFLVAGEARTGNRGARERPYRSTGISTALAVHHVGHAELSRQVELATVAAYHAELAAAPPEAIRSHLRWTLRLPPAALAEMTERIEAILGEYADLADRHGGGEAITTNLLWSLHDVPPPP
ncbi:winged helix-turn-helix domain-containing protein [Phytohabitans sp. ZYX-F-186]|uniref:Winged helix-turn-helix domain-containing protein n=1 Tax=Phytohabitans maris TaxID=3071409 RepID=A0ABU0ZQU1_9ACTN|nr:winged helix-turn-helix domain-containing protein [Phytohabitans sp. ZYX-F-186]MDQ7908287.1 winged helix-turn-helix domain-containing protein [Phytohabitans sp. ZYX-F-186]